MKNRNYVLVLKTGDSELRALENASNIKHSIFPIIELTRGKKSKNDKVGLIEKRLNKIRTIFKGEDICLDITTSSALSNPEIDDLYSPENGYKKWIDFLLIINTEGIFKSITPTIIVNVDDPNFEDNLKEQVKKLTENFNSLVYRNSLSDDACYDDIDLLKDIIEQSNKQFYFVIDCEYIAPGAWRSFADKAKVRIQKIKSKIKNTHFIITSTSFPNNVSEIGNAEADTFRINELDLYNDICGEVNDIPIIYGDYGSINPIRNDGIIMSRGWIPRIDVALQREIFYVKEKRGKNEYSVAYTIAARRISSDKRFPSHLNTNWGIKQILNSALGNAPGSTPSFWISVRMNMHIEQQVMRLKSL